MDVTLRLTLTAQPAARDVGRAAEQAATAAPPHYEFAFGQAVRAWAAGDTEALTRAADADLPGAVHLLAVMTVALGVSVLDHDGLNALLNCLPEDPR
jgi:hypothetical protein